MVHASVRARGGTSMPTYPCQCTVQAHVYLQTRSWLGARCRHTDAPSHAHRAQLLQVCRCGRVPHTMHVLEAHSHVCTHICTQDMCAFHSCVLLLACMCVFTDTLSGTNTFPHSDMHAPAYMFMNICCPQTLPGRYVV